MNGPIFKVSTLLIEQLHGTPNVYLAGKISKNDWRHPLVQGIQKHFWTEGPLVQPSFNYVGPFTAGCNHGCLPKLNSHGNIADCCFDQELNQRELVRHCLQAVDKAHLVFCYIERLDCHGTIVEIARAHMSSIPVVIAFAPGLADSHNNEMWFPSALANRLYYDISRYQLPALLERSIKEFT